MAPEAVLETLRQLWLVLRQNNIQAAVVGGLAMAAWKHPRTTIRGSSCEHKACLNHFTHRHEIPSMTHHKMLLNLLVGAFLGTLIAGQPDTAAASEETLVSFDDYPSGLIEPQDAKVATTQGDGQCVLQVNTGHNADWPGITLLAPDRYWDLSAFQKITLQVRNIGTKPVTIHCRVDSPGGDGKKNSITAHVDPRPGELKDVTVTLQRLLPTALAEKLYGMRGYPGGYAKEKGVDMPVIIGEFHFGALDRGMFHTGLRPRDSQKERAQAYRNYVTGALKNPCLVGSHWFQYGDQATTGRGDGENYQIGLVTICDRPYPETVAVIRAVGSSMYRTRLGAD